MAFTWVTNAHGPSLQPTACRNGIAYLTTESNINGFYWGTLTPTDSMHAGTQHSV